MKVKRDRGCFDASIVVRVTLSTLSIQMTNVGKDEQYDAIK